MNKRQFLAKLEKELSKLNKEEKRRQLDYYEEIINDRIDEGMSEEAAVERLGSVQGVAARIISQATPEQMAKKKKIGVLGWIGIVLGAIILIVAALFILFMVDRVEESGIVDEIEDKIEQRLELKDDWISGGDVSFTVSELKGLDIVWSCGDVTIDETEGSEILVKSGKDDALEYQLKDGVLYIETVKDYSGNAKLRVLIPEDIMQLLPLSLVSSGGNVAVEGENFSEIDLVTSGGDVRIKPENAEELNVVSSGGNVVIELDEDDAFVMSYAVNGGKASVGFDRSFAGGSFGDYDHSLGRASCLKLDVSVAGGDIKLIDD